MGKKRAFLIQYWPWIIFLIAFSLRLALLCEHNFALGWEGDGFPKSDAKTYDVVAMNILKGRGFGIYLSGFKYSSISSPLYPLFLAFMYSFFGHNYMAVKIAQLVIGSLNAVVVYAIGKRLFTRSVGIISGLIFASYLPHMWWTSALMREVFSTFLFGLAYLAMIKAIDEVSLKNNILAGISIGIAILMRGQALVFLPVLAICGFIGSNRKQYFSILLFALLVISPWVIRSMVVHNGAVIMETAAGRQFWTGTNPKYRGLFYCRAARHEALWEKPFQSEAQRCGRLNREAIGFIKDNPEFYFGAVKARLKRFWHIGGLRVVRFNPKGIEVFLPYMVMFFGFVGALHGFFLSPRVIPLILIILSYSLVSGVCGSHTRYRLPLEPFLIVLSGYTVYLISQIRSRDWRKLYPCLSPSAIPLPPLVKGDKGGFKGGKGIGVGGIGEGDWFPGKLAKCLKICGVFLILIFAIRLCIAYWGPGERLVQPRVSEEKIQLALKKHNLLTRWEKQDKKLTYQDIFLDQAENGGYVTKYDDAIIIWKGRMEYIIRDVNGNIRNFTFYLNPSPHDFGQQVAVGPVPGFGAKAEKFEGGDIVFIIARIKTTGRALGDPGVDFFEILK